MYDLIKSMKDHAEIPSTFNGEIPEFAFGNGDARLLIGQRYLVTDPDGNDSTGLLTTAVVIESEQKGIADYHSSVARQEFMCGPSDTEMAAWRRHPDTFLGEVGQRSTKAEDRLDLYDFIYNSYRETPKERLLEFMADASDIEQLRELEQASNSSRYICRALCLFYTCTAIP
jgi:hypothetical protein